MKEIPLLEGQLVGGIRAMGDGGAYDFERGLDGSQAWFRQRREGARDVRLFMAIKGLAYGLHCRWS